MTATIDNDISIETLPERFGIQDEYIADMRERYAGLCVADEESYQVVKAAHADVTKTINLVECKRVEFKKPALDFGKAVDAEAKRITAKLEKVREPLAKEKDAADQMRREAMLAEERKAEEERQAKIKAEQDAMAAERKKLDEERAALDAERAEQDRKNKEEQDKVAAANAAEAARLKKIADELNAASLAQRKAKEAANREEFERQAKAQAEADAKERLEIQQAEDTARLVAAAEAAIEKQKAIEAARPDLERVHAFAAAIRALQPPTVTESTAVAAITKAMGRLNITATDLEAFQIS